MRITAGAYLAASRVHALLQQLRRAFLVPRAAAVGATTAAAVSGSPRRIADVLAARRPERRMLYAIESHASAYDALCKMMENHVTVLVVMDASAASTPVGLITQSDYLQKVALARARPEDVCAADIMTPLDRCAYVYEGNDVDSAMHVMAVVGAHHLPVLDSSSADGRLIAVVGLPELLGLTRERMEASRARAALPVRYVPAAAAAAHDSALQRQPQHVAQERHGHAVMRGNGSAARKTTASDAGEFPRGLYERDGAEKTSREREVQRHQDAGGERNGQPRLQ